MDGAAYRPHVNDEPARRAFDARAASVAQHIRDREARGQRAGSRQLAQSSLMNVARFVLFCAATKKGMGGVVRQYRFSRVLRLTFRVWLRNLIPFTLLSVLLSAPLVISLVLDDGGLGSAELIFSQEHQSYPLRVLRGLTLLLTPMITHRVVQFLDGVELSLVRSVRLSVRGMLTMVLFAMFGLVLAFLPVLGVIAVLCLSCIGFVAIPVAIAERLNPLDALGRSSDLIVRRLRTTIGLMLAAVVIAAMPYGATSILFAALYDVTPGNPQSMQDTIARMQQLRPYAIALVAMTGVLLPFQGIVRAVSYVLIRRDSTGAQEELAEVFG